MESAEVQAPLREPLVRDELALSGGLDPCKHHRSRFSEITDGRNFKFSAQSGLLFMHRFLQDAASGLCHSFDSFWQSPERLKLTHTTDVEKEKGPKKKKGGDKKRRGESKTSSPWARGPI